jgi:8-oxo-dGTP diphosphatase
MELIRAAGGLLWRGRNGKRQLAVIHRPHREDWSLPKGKLEEGERWEIAALREVEEETGCKARILSFAGVVHYVPRRTPKVVVFWNMELVKEGPLEHVDEVDEVAWLSVDEAMKRLDHEAERELLAEATSAA